MVQYDRHVRRAECVSGSSAYQVSAGASYFKISGIFSTDFFLFYRGLLLYVALGLNLGTVPVDTVLASYYGSRY